MNGKKAEEILKELADAANLEIKISDRQVTVMKKAPIVQQGNNIKVTGQVLMTWVKQFLALT